MVGCVTWEWAEFNLHAIPQGLLHPENLFFLTTELVPIFIGEYQPALFPATLSGTELSILADTHNNFLLPFNGLRTGQGHVSGQGVEGLGESICLNYG